MENVCRVKPMDNAVVPNKVLAHLDLLVRLARMAPMENTVQMERKAKVDLKAPIQDTHVQHQLDVKNAQKEPKDPLDPLDLLEKMVAKDNLAAKVTMAKMAAPVQLDRLAMLARLAAMVNQVPKVIQAKMPKLEARDQLDPKERKAAMERLARMEIKEQQAKPAPLAPLEALERKAKPAIMERKDPLEDLAQLEQKAQMPSIVLAHVVPKYKESHHWINPKTLIGQNGFDHDNQFSLHNLKLIVSIHNFHL